MPHPDFYTYDEDGTNRRENITDWALEQFRAHYGDRSITKWDIFHYVYAVLHHPVYRERYAANLKRELPRVPFVSASSASSAPSALKASAGDHVVANSTAESRRDDSNLAPDVSPGSAYAKTSESRRDDREAFRCFVAAGQRLAELHVKYEEQPDATELTVPHVPAAQRPNVGVSPTWLENPQAHLDYRVEKMRLSKDKSTLFYNDYWMLTDIPAEVYEYRLGNRSALEWIVDQYQVSTDKRSGITNDPNREDDPEYIKRLIGQIIYVSLETVKIVKALPKWAVENAEAAGA